MKLFRTLRDSLIFALTSVAISGCLCSKQQDSAKEKSPEQKLLDEGRLAYQANCIACHNANPKLQGSQGPEVFGSSKELLTTRLLEAKYPEGYTPKRKSLIMPALPHLKNQIDALYYFLNSKE